MNKETAQRLFNYMSEEHGVTLLDTDMQEIESILCPERMEYNKPLKGFTTIHNISPDGCLKFSSYWVSSSKEDAVKNACAINAPLLAIIDLSKHYEGEGL